MSAAVNPFKGTGIILGSEVGAVANVLRRITVRIHGGGAGFGSGVIWRPDGVIVTNAHVVCAPRLRVELGDGRIYTGTVIGRDVSRDLAAIRIAPHELPVPSIRDVRTLRAGELVLAVGHPHGEIGAVSAGIVHHPPRTDDWVIADVRLAPGNSGGPLADAVGSLVGINSMIVDGLGWAVSSNAVARWLRELSIAEVA